MYTNFTLPLRVTEFLTMCTWIYVSQFAIACMHPERAAIISAHMIGYLNVLKVKCAHLLRCMNLFGCFITLNIFMLWAMHLAWKRLYSNKRYFVPPFFLMTLEIIEGTWHGSVCDHKIYLRTWCVGYFFLWSQTNPILALH